MSKGEPEKHAQFPNIASNPPGGLSELAQLQPSVAEHFPVVERLHTDVLEDKYGPITPIVLEHNARVRQVHLRDERGVSRTFAITLFPESGIPAPLSDIDHQIRAGGAIGKTFRDAGFEVRKNVLEVLIIKMPQHLKDAFQTDENFAKARTSEFLARSSDGGVFKYGTVIEIYHPDFRSATINDTDKSQELPPVDILRGCGINLRQVWQQIGGEKTFDPDQAVMMSFRPILNIRRQMYDILYGVA